MKFYSILMATLAYAQTPAPEPNLPQYAEYYTRMIKTTSDYGDFPLGTKFAGWAIVDDTAQESLFDWIDVIANEKQNTAEWDELSAILPNGFALVGVIYI